MPLYEVRIERRERAEIIIDAESENDARQLVMATAARSRRARERLFEVGGGDLVIPLIDLEEPEPPGGMYVLAVDEVDPDYDPDNLDDLDGEGVMFLVREVPSSSGRGVYTVTVDVEEGLASCTCPAGTRRGQRCKHLSALGPLAEEVEAPAERR